MHASIVFLTAFTFAAPAPKDLAKPVPPIVGVWELSNFTSNGLVKELEGTFTWEFTADGKWIVRTGGKENSGERQYILNAKNDPATIDLIANKDGKQSAGIVRVQGDTLTICLNPGKHDRPTAFEAEKGSPNFLYSFKRIKKE